MASSAAALVSTTRNTIGKTKLTFKFRLFSISPFSSSSSSSFSTLCRNQQFFTPSHSPPVPKKVPFTVSAHGTKWQDPYHWMSNPNDPDFIDHLRQENSYADAFMKDTEELQRTLYSEMISRMPSEISTPPERWGPWLYYQFIPEGKEYPVLCRKLASGGKSWMKNAVDYMVKGSLKEQILLDWNEVAEMYGYVHVGTCRVSPDNNFLAYTLDVTGDEQFFLQVKDLRRNSVISNHRVEGVVSLAWAQDGSTLFYTLCDQNQRPYRVHCTKIGSDSMNDIHLFEESDSRFCVDITSTKDGKYITVNSNSRTSSEEKLPYSLFFGVYVINAVNPQSEMQRFRKRVSGVQHFLEHHHGFFYFLTNAPLSKDEVFGVGNYYLGRCRAENLHNVENIILPNEDMGFVDMDIFNEHLVLFVNKDGSSSICSIDMRNFSNCEEKMRLDDLNPWFFPLPSDMCSLSPGSNHDFVNAVYRVVLSSPVMPDVIMDYDMSSKTSIVVQQEDMPDMNFRPKCYSQNHKKNELDDIRSRKQKDLKDFSDTYVCEKKEVISHDGIRIPLTILYSKEVHKQGQSPGLLHGYGAYGETTDKSWCPDRLSLLDRGWVFAFADVRGGAGPDPSWHTWGSGLQKLNSIHDFVSCGQYLVDEGYVHEQQLSAIAHSAGCFLLGAAINMYPHMFRAAVLKVPFLDVCNTLLETNLPLTILDYEEFGNPQIESHFCNILKISPYDNIREKFCYPSMLVMSSFNDSRVGIWEAAKWVARVREVTCSMCSSSVILRSNMTGGHFGEGGRFGHCEETAHEYAFLLKSSGYL
ncbi:OLC1v1032549C1 [Oldenlandia corymbosa var. corymbosa]|uniref:Prolyl endopeptidase n=1 Tax=Oldenlandia corymbosa var. corymbosa TaxID=529605 RepID=A0AAV1CN15_OLDCO|nr:OLC1v1032549C1 [Oldenlandia corymbosa var. corymbosa]